MNKRVTFMQSKVRKQILPQIDSGICRLPKTKFNCNKSKSNGEFNSCKVSTRCTNKATTNKSMKDNSGSKTSSRKKVFCK